MEGLTERQRKNFDKREEWFSIKRHQKRLEARLQLDKAPQIGVHVEIISSRLKKAQLGEKGRIFWKNISQWDTAIVGIKMLDGRSVFVPATSIKPVT